MALKKIRKERQRLADVVYEQILEAIQTGEIGPDERLVQEKLSEELEVSRTPLREALLRLEQDGILVTSARGGFLIRRLTETEIKQLYQARAAVETQAARILTAQGDSKTLTALRKFIRKAEKSKCRSVRDYFDINRTIHRHIVELTDNPYLLEMFDNIWNRGPSFNLFAALEKVDLSKSLGTHELLVDAIESGDLNAATQAIVEHIWDGLTLQFEALGFEAPER